jgi:hypothetical protein
VLPRILKIPSVYTGFGAGICDPQIPAKSSTQKFTISSFMTPNKEINNFLHQILATPQIPPPNTSPKHTMSLYFGNV